MGGSEPRPGRWVRDTLTGRVGIYLGKTEAGHMLWPPYRGPAWAVADEFLKVLSRQEELLEKVRALNERSTRGPWR
ncbi:hypothetical protein [Streptomyces sp. YIM 98790]|uniref:hypothetical protein n=1 Tax=Streptomyces sp. YIM 98790 TaxID=2689077 RepID=UPI0014082C02|nr:hypothetical protein [Streptomyces sp. YIM 98790]